MAKKILDVVGLRTPETIMQLAIEVADMRRNDVLEVFGDCPFLDRDVKTWCVRLRKEILSVKCERDNKKRIRIQL